MPTQSNMEKKIDEIMNTMYKIDGKVQSMDATIKEREKSEILRNEVITQSIKTLCQAHDDLKERVDGLEKNQGKVVWLIITIVIGAIMGTIIVV